MKQNSKCQVWGFARPYLVFSFIWHLSLRLQSIFEDFGEDSGDHDSPDNPHDDHDHDHDIDHDHNQDIDHHDDEDAHRQSDEVEEDEDEDEDKRWR